MVTRHDPLQPSKALYNPLRPSIIPYRDPPKQAAPVNAVRVRRSSTNGLTDAVLHTTGCKLRVSEVCESAKWLRRFLIERITLPTVE